VHFAKWNNGLCKVADCSSMRSPLWWNVWMNCCSYGISLAVSCNSFNSVIVSARVPYSWMFCRICCAYADWGSLFFMYLICSRNLRDRLRLVWPMYALLHFACFFIYGSTAQLFSTFPPLYLHLKTQRGQ